MSITLFRQQNTSGKSNNNRTNRMNKSNLCIHLTFNVCIVNPTIHNHIFSKWYVRIPFDCVKSFSYFMLTVFLSFVSVHFWAVQFHYVNLNLVITIDEPLAANGKHFGFEIRQNSGHNRHITAANNMRILKNRNNGFHSHSIDDIDVHDDGFDSSHVETSDYSDDKYFETKKHR